MAVTKIWDVKGRLDNPINYVMNPDKGTNPEYEKAFLQALGDVIEYAANEDKTERHYFVSGINCNTTYARRQFQTTKNAYDNGMWELVGCVTWFGEITYILKICDLEPVAEHNVGSMKAIVTPMFDTKFLYFDNETTTIDVDDSYFIYSGG